MYVALVSRVGKSIVYIVLIRCVSTSDGFVVWVYHVSVPYGCVCRMGIPVTVSCGSVFWVCGMGYIVRMCLLGMWHGLYREDVSSGYVAWVIS